MDKLIECLKRQVNPDFIEKPIREDVKNAMHGNFVNYWRNGKEPQITENGIIKDVENHVRSKVRITYSIDQYNTTRDILGTKLKCVST